MDTCILVDFLRGKDEAVALLRGLELRPSVSSLTLAELWAGAKGQKEARLLESFAEHLEVVPLTKSIAIAGGKYRRKYGRSHGVGIVDALIGATALEEKLKLLTRNLKHFPMLSGLKSPY